MPALESRSTAWMIWLVLRPKMERSPPDSDQWPPAWADSLMRMPRMGLAFRALERSRMSGSSSGISTTRMQVKPILVA